MSGGLNFNTPNGRMTCGWTDGMLFPGTPSWENFNPLVGFDPNVQCYLVPRGLQVPPTPSCQELADWKFVEGPFTGQNIFPQATPEGLKITNLGGPDTFAPSNEFFVKDGNQNGFFLTSLTGGASAADVGGDWEVTTSEVPGNSPSNMMVLNYEATNWVPGLIVVKKEERSAFIFTGFPNGTVAGSDERAPMQMVDFCGLHRAEKKPDEKPAASSGGDPHFKTWSGQKFDFHGGCDLVLLQNAGFNHGLGLDVHIRTKIEGSWSYIDTAAVRMGDHILEIAGGLTEIPYWLDGTKTANLETGDATLGDYAIHFRRINDHQSKTRLDLGNGNALSIETFKRFVRVNVKTNTPESFAGTYGMLGSFPEGEKVGRDTTTIIEDANEFGQEWQVLYTEAKLFHQESDVQPPMRCVMPDATRKSQSRRLGEATVSEEDAALACARVSEEDRDACIFDVMATDDKDMAGSY